MYIFIYTFLRFASVVPDESDPEPDEDDES